MRIKQIAYYGAAPLVSKRKCSAMFEHPDIKESDITQVVETLKNRDLSFPIEGGIIKRLEKAFSEYLDSRYILACNNGSSAILSAYFALGYGIEPTRSLKGKEVVCPSYTWWASIEQVLLLGGTPVFCDISPETLTVDPKDLEKKITKNTAAIMVPHLWGEVSDLERISKISEKYKIQIVEDASHALGAEYNGKKIGTLFDIGAFSLQAGKPLVAGEGGLLVTDNKEFFERAIVLGHYERIGETSEKFRKYNKTGLGYKFRISTLNAALAYAQLQNYSENIRKENELMDCFISGIDYIEGVKVPRQKDPKFKRGGFFSTRLILDPNFFRVKKEVIMEALNAEGIAAEEEYYPLLHLQERFKNRARYCGLGTLPVSEKLHPLLIAIPPLRRGTIADVEMLSESFKRVCNYFKR